MQRFASYVRRVWPWLLLAGVALAALAWGGRHVWQRAHWRAGQAAVARFNGNAAQPHLEVCLAAWPDDADVQFLAARAARLAGDFDKAQTHLRACERLGLGLASAIVLEWSLLRASVGDLPQSVEEHLLTRIDNTGRDGEIILEALARGYTRTFRIREAFNCLDHWDTLRPGTAAAHELRGHVWRYVRKLPKAVPEYQKALEAEPDREEARKWLAVGLIEAGRYAEALVHLQKLLRAGDDLAMQTDLARCYRGLGQTDKARAALDAVLERDPEFGPALRVRGEVELAEAPAQAEAWLRKAVAAMPYDYSTHWVLLQTLLHQGKDADAKKQRAIVDELKERVERVSDLTTVKMPARPNDPALHCELGALLIGLGEKDSGRRWLMTALQHDPDYAPAHRVLADLYDREGDTELAGRHRQRAGS